MADASALSSEFPAATSDAWRALVAKTLGDVSFDSLRKQTAEGLPIEPLYSPGEAKPAGFASPGE